MSGKTTGTSQECTSAQKRLCQRVATLFDLNSKVCEQKGDTLSTRAYATLATLMRDVASNGPRWLEDKIAERQSQLAAYEDKEQY